jgi:hypothetical protein
MYTYGDNPNTKNELRRLKLVKGICHEHTDHSDGSATPKEAVDISASLGYSFFVITDHETASAVKPMRDYRDSKNLDLAIVGGQEFSLSIIHMVSWGFNDTQPSPQDPMTRINLIHNLSAPIYFSHPSWAMYTNHPRIWDHDLYPFDGYEVINSGFIQGNGNLAMKYPWFVASDTHGNDEWSFSQYINYALTDSVSDDGQWWTEACAKRRLVGYDRKDDLYVGDKIVFDEISGRLNDNAPPEIRINVTEEYSNNTAKVVITVLDDSPLKSVTMRVNGDVKSLQKSPSDYTLYHGLIGPFEGSQNISLTVSAADELGYSNST